MIAREMIVMRPLWKDILAAVWLGMIIPGIVLNALVLKEHYRERREPAPVAVETEDAAETLILIKDPDGINSLMDIEVYLTGVLLAELPGAFHQEAMMAQAAAARTYAWKAYTKGGKHADRSVCTDSACCQAYLSEAEYLSRGGTQESIEKIRHAVLATSPMAVYYDGELIEATYFSSSGGSTESALAVWGTNYPYLQSVSSPEIVPSVLVSFTSDEFERLLGRTLSGAPEEWFAEMIFTDGGGVSQLEICGVTYTGVQLRSLLGLRSTAFSLSVEDGEILVTTDGYGHRVGMSQYGANAMAESGHTWQQILQHYYPGTTLAPAYT